MKNKIITIALTVLILFSLSVTISATSINSEYSPRLYDNAQLLSDSEIKSVGKMIDEISEKYDVDIVIVTLETIDGMSPDEAAETFYDTMEFGGKNGGVLLLINMEGRDVTVFYDKAIDFDIADTIREDITDDLTEGEYAEAFELFAEKCDYYVNGELNGYPFKWGRNIIVSLVIGLVVALIATGVMKSKLKSVAFKDSAAGYVVDGSLNITGSNDLYLYSTMTRTKRQSSSSSSGSSSSRGSSSGKF